MQWNTLCKLEGPPLVQRRSEAYQKLETSVSFSLYLILPYTYHLCIPLHPERFLDSLVLPAVTRPHPSLLYILFAEASRVISKSLPMPYGSKLVANSYPVPDDSLLQHAVNLQNAFCERAQDLLQEGMHKVDRPLDLLKASTGICRFLISQGRSLEAWHSICLRLVVACGLHRITSPVIGTTGPTHTPQRSMPSIAINSGFGTTDFGMVQDDQFSTSRTQRQTASSWRTYNDNRSMSQSMPALSQSRTPRPKPVIIPPPTDNLQLWERIELFWAVKELDWGMSSHWGWTLALHDSEIQTPWPRPRSDYDRGAVDERQVDGIWELLHPTPANGLVQLQTPRVLALKSLCLLNQASR